MERIFHRKSYLLLIAFFSLPLAAGLTLAAPSQNFSGATPLEWSQRLADSEMARQTNAPKWDYTMGLFTLSLLKLNQEMPDARLVKFSDEKVGSLISSNGFVQGYKRSEYQLDALNPGKTALALFEAVTNHDARYLHACDELVSQLDDQPRTFDGGFWHKQRYTNQMWLDGIYMAEPFLAEYGQLFGNLIQSGYSPFSDVAKQFHLINEHLYDAKSGLYYHGWDAAKIQIWANPVTGASSNFWGRADGWYAMALADTLQILPANHPARSDLLAQFKKFSAGIVKWQHAGSGLWWQVMDQGDRKGNYLEATASAMFVYALAKGVNDGELSPDIIPAILKGYNGLATKLIKTDGGRVSLTQCCSVAGLGFTGAHGRPRDGSFDYYISEPIVDNDMKGVGPFILAGIEVQKILDSQNRSKAAP
jgi:unsaturated rhamnogalacturonyl hydrolase